jgi:hypothetical protein
MEFDDGILGVRLQQGAVAIVTPVKGRFLKGAVIAAMGNTVEFIQPNAITITGRFVKYPLPPS